MLNIPHALPHSIFPTYSGEKWLINLAWMIHITRQSRKDSNLQISVIVGAYFALIIITAP